MDLSHQCPQVHHPPENHSPVFYTTPLDSSINPTSPPIWADGHGQRREWGCESKAWEAATEPENATSSHVSLKVRADLGRSNEVVGYASDFWPPYHIDGHG